MIIDWFYDDDDFTIPKLYERTRDKDGVLHERIISESDDGYMRPFCWIPENTSSWKIQRLSNRFPSAKIRWDETSIGLDKEKLVKLEVSNPTDLWDIKDEIKTYEADLVYVDQYLLSQYPDKVPDFHPRIWYFDLEWDVEDGFTTVMAVSDTHNEQNVVFAWKEGKDLMSSKWVDREGGYMLHEFCSEEAMHEAFIQHLDVCNPDILVAHAIMWADLPHLIERLSDPNRLSPINQVTKPFKNKRGYKDTAQPIKGRLCWDSSAQHKHGSGFETIWQMSGRGQLPNRKLNTIAEQLGLGSKLTEEIEGMTVYNGWRDYYDSFVDYCLRDTTLLRDIDEKLNATSFFIAMQQLCGVSFGSTHKVTRYFRGLVGRRTEMKALSARNVKREALTAAHIPDPIGGRHEGVAVVDYASLYPNIILSDNLCHTTKRDSGGEGIKTLGNGTHWCQKEKGLLPKIVEEMLSLRKEYKLKMKEAKSADEKLSYDMLQSATKVAVNAIYGMTGMKSLVGMWIDLDIASAITYRGREAIRHLLTESELQGYQSLYGHTDSAFIKVPFEEATSLAEHLTKTARDKLKLSAMDVELEAYFDYWTTAPIKNRYFGIKVWPESDAGTLKVAGYEMKASTSAKITKRLQSTAMQLVGTGKNEEEVTTELRKMSTPVRDGLVDINDVVCSTRISMPFKDYTSPTAGVKAALYYNQQIAKHESDMWKQGDSVSWVYVKGVKTDKVDYVKIGDKQEKIRFVAFREKDELDDFVIDWGKITDTLVKKKLMRIYESVGWDVNPAAGAIVPKSYFEEEIK